MTGFPTTQVLLDDGTGTFPYDITTKARLAYGVTRGRQDEQSSVTPGTLSLTLDNTDGRFTLGSTTIANPSPIRVDQRIRVKVTIPAAASAVNLLTAAQASFEDGTTGGWVAAGTALPTVANDATRAWSGTKALKITWAGSGTNPQAQIQPSGYTIGNTYTFAAWVYVPTGSPDVRVGAGSTVGALTSAKDQWVRLSVTFTAASTTPTFFLRSSGTPAASSCWLDAAMVVAGSTIDEFNTATQTTYNRFTGYVQSWPVEWPSGADTLSEVTITATDAQARAERWPLKAIPDQEIRAIATLSAYYPLSEPADAMMALDLSGNQAEAMLVGSTGTVTFASTVGQLAGAAFNGGLGGGYLYRSLTTTPLNAWTIFLFYASTATYSAGINMVGFNGNNGTWPGPGDGAIHSYAFSSDAGGNYVEYVDGAVTSSGVGGSLSPLRSFSVGGRAPGTGVANYAGSIAAVALYPSVLTGTQVAQLSTAGLTGFSGESGTTRITRLAGYSSLPLGTLDTSLTNVAATDISGSSTAEALRQVADAEVGILYVDGSGNFVFHNRNRVPAKTAPDITVTVDALDPGTAFTVDTQGAVNYFEATAKGTGLTQVVRSTTSELGDGTATYPGHGRYPSSTEYLVTTDAEALDRANWVVSTHAEPTARIGTLTIDLLTLDINSVASLLAAEPDTWIRVTGLPSQTPGGTTGDFVVQGFSESLGADSWSITFNVVNQSLFSAWILGDATYGVLDTTTRLYI